ncbi:MAG: 4Fe-4S dicluster domain-containing protein [Clostridiales bacterium]|nr:4Fe-4S dicluster domain-containing protein [Clostridiales bacterium]
MNIVIDGKNVVCEKDEILIEVARRNDIVIPTLCYLKDVCYSSNCRICMVEVNGRLVPACSTKVSDGMVVVTTSDKIAKSRKKTLELIISNHHKDCDNCQKKGVCKLEDLCNEYGVNSCKYDYEKKNYRIDNSSPCITRDDNKCILCGRCVNVCANIQSVSALTKQQRGFNTFVGCVFDNDIVNSTCIGCGQCTLVCPTGALVEHSEVTEVNKLLSDNHSYVTCQIAPAVRVALAEEFGAPIGTFDEGRMVTALKMLGFKKVFDVNLGADITVLEEANELIDRIERGVKLPQFSSCCPGWFQFVEKNYPQYLDNLSTCKSPTEMLGALVKDYYSKQNNINADTIKVVDIMPCTAKKHEKTRAQDVDHALTTRELARMIKSAGIDYLNLEPTPFDTPLSEYTSAGLIFGVSGGVTEAALRFASEKLTGGRDKVDFDEVRNADGIKEVDVKCGGITLKLCIVSGLANTRKVMEDIASGKKDYHFVEVMACPGGCINGGGQPYVDYDKISVDEVKRLRANAIMNADKGATARISTDNKFMKELYETYITDRELAHKLFHWKH